MTKTARILIAATGVLVAAILIYFLPPVHSRLAWRLDELRTEIIRFFNPPEAVVFLPTQNPTLDAIITATLASYTATVPATPPPPPPGPTPTPTPAPTPLPAAVLLDVPTYVDQYDRWNYCGPANLTMALNFWGWSGNRDDVARAIKPGENDPDKTFIERGRSDLNVMPYEMVDFVNQQTPFRALYRLGGEVDLVKRLIASGFPVIIEKGYTEVDSAGQLSWMGHYAFTTGYDDSRGVFYYQNSYPQPRGSNGKNQPVSYQDFITGWRAFDYLFIIVYPAEREADLLQALGPWVDQQWAAQHALDRAILESQTLTGVDQFFAWFNRGTSHVALYQYFDARLAYDYALRTLYNALPEGPQRPYRMLWYQTGPYFAYYYSGDYQSLINLATQTLRTPRVGSTLEESLYWRALAYYALGDTASAYADLRAAVRNNPNFQAGLNKMQEWGITP